MKLEPPSWLPEDAKEIFVDTVEFLGVNCLPSDRSVIADFAMAQSDVISFTAQVKFEGETLVSIAGNLYVNPLLNVLMSRRKDLERLREDLGMTPQARGNKLRSAGKSALASAMGKR